MIDKKKADKFVKKELKNMLKKEMKQQIKKDVKGYKKKEKAEKKKKGKKQSKLIREQNFLPYNRHLSYKFSASGSLGFHDLDFT